MCEVASISIHQAHVKARMWRTCFVGKSRRPRSRWAGARARAREKQKGDRVMSACAYMVITGWQFDVNTYFMNTLLDGEYGGSVEHGWRIAQVGRLDEEGDDLVDGSGGGRGDGLVARLAAVVAVATTPCLSAMEHGCESVLVVRF